MRQATLRDRLLTISGRAAALGLAGFLGLAASGCGGEADPVGSAITDAGRQLATVSPALDVDERTRIYAQVASTLQAVSADAEGVQASSVSLLNAQVTAGRGQIELERGHDLASESLAEVASLGSALERYARTHASEQALARQDLSDIFSQLDSDAAEINSSLVSTRQELARVRGSLESEIAERDQRQSDARTLREQIARMMEGAQSATATQRVGVLEEARELGRRADRLEADASRIDLRIESARGSVRDAEADVELLERQLEVNASARASTEQRQRTLREQRAELQQSLQSLASEILSRYDTLVSEYGEGAQAAFESAASTLARASAEARRAQSDIQGARQSSAAIEQLRATALMARAAADTRIAALGDEIAALVAGGADRADVAAQLMQSRNEAIEAAAGAYESAGAVIEEARDRAQELRAMLPGGAPATGEQDVDDMDADDMVDDGFEGEDG